MLLPHVAELLTILSTQKMMTRNEIFDVAINSVDTNLRSSDHISQILNSLKDKELVVRHADKNAFAITAKGKQALLEHSQSQPTINEPAPQPEPKKSEEEKPSAATDEMPVSIVQDTDVNATNPKIIEIMHMQLAVVDKLQQLGNQNTIALKQDKIAILIKIAESSFIDVETVAHLREIADYLQKVA
jgi:predicted transcriptional regulator